MRFLASHEQVNITSWRAAASSTIAAYTRFLKKTHIKITKTKSAKVFNTWIFLNK